MSSATEIQRWAAQQVSRMPHITLDTITSAVALAYLQGALDTLADARAELAVAASTNGAQ